MMLLSLTQKKELTLGQIKIILFERNDGKTLKGGANFFTLRIVCDPEDPIDISPLVEQIHPEVPDRERYRYVHVMIKNYPEGESRYVDTSTPSDKESTVSPGYMILADTHKKDPQNPNYDYDLMLSGIQGWDPDYNKSCMDGKVPNRVRSYVLHLVQERIAALKMQ